MANDPLLVFRAYVDAEYSCEWQRKGAIETRALAVVTANIGLVTLFLTLSQRLDLPELFDSTTPGAFTLVGLMLGGASILAALVSVLPMNYPTPCISELENVLNELSQPGGPDEHAVSEEIVEMRLAQLSQAQSSNDFKATAGLIALVVLALAAIVDGVAIVLALG